MKFELKNLRGVLPALISPLTREGAVDEAGTRRLVEHVLAARVHGLLPLRSTGETASLDEGARRQVLAAVMGAAAARVPGACRVRPTHLKTAPAERSRAPPRSATA